MNQRTPLDPQRRIQRENTLIGGTLILAMQALGLYGNVVSRGQQEVTGVLIFVCLGLSVAAIICGLRAHMQPARILLAVSLMIMSVVTLLINGGLADPRSSAMMLAVPFALIAVLGLDRVKPILVACFLLFFTFLLLDGLGALKLIYPLLQHSEELERRNTVIIITLGLVSFSLATRSFLAQREVIQAAADSAEEANIALSLALESTRRAQQAESKFLSNMSHEIRNPIHGIKGMLEQIETDQCTANERADYARRALLLVDHLHSLLDDILDLKKIEENGVLLEIKPVDLHAQLLTAQAANQAAAEKRGLRYVANYSLEALPRYVLGDPTRMFQVGSNIMSNAIKFTEHGTITETIEYRSGFISTTIADTGIGMSPDTIHRLFQRFTQGDASIRKRFGGSGLGLWLTKQILDAMGGKLTVESELNVGSTFRFSFPLPIDPSHQIQGADEPATTPPPFPAAVSLSDIRILCVDDVETNLMILSLPLSRAGATIETALSAAEALDRLEQATYDLVITDISMPTMSGEELQLVIKSRNPGLPVFAVTGNVMEEDRQRYLSNGFAAVFSKPLHIQQLIQTISDLNSGASATSAVDP